MAKNNILIVAHGKSEMILCNAIGSTLRIKMEFDSEDKGNECIQICHLEERMRNGCYRNAQSLRKEFKSLNFKISNGTPDSGFRIYTIMDTDDSPHLKRSYETGNLFSKSPFRNNIVPIFNSPCLDDVMRECGYPINNNEKVESYNRLFEGRVADDILIEFLERLRGCENTNFDVFVEDCMKRTPEYQNKVR